MMDEKVIMPGLNFDSTRLEFEKEDRIGTVKLKRYSHKQKYSQFSLLIPKQVRVKLNHFTDLDLEVYKSGGILREPRDGRDVPIRWKIAFWRSFSEYVSQDDPILDGLEDYEIKNE